MTTPPSAPPSVSPLGALPPLRTLGLLLLLGGVTGCWQPGALGTPTFGPFRGPPPVAWVGEGPRVLADTFEGLVLLDPGLDPGLDPEPVPIESAGRFCVDAEGSRVAQADADDLFVWDLASGDELERWALYVPDGFSSPQVEQVAWSADGLVGVVGYRATQVFRPGEAAPVWQEVGDGTGGDGLAFSPDGARLVYGGSAPLRIVELASGTSTTLPGGEEAKTVSVGGGFVVSGDLDGAVLLWTEAGEVLPPLDDGGPRAIEAVRISEDGELVAVSNDLGVLQRGPRDGGEGRSLSGGRSVGAVEFTRDLSGAAVSYCLPEDASGYDDDDDESAERRCFVGLPTFGGTP